MKVQYWIILFLIISASGWLILQTGSIEPRSEERIDLNWRFTMEDDSIFSEPEYDDSGWEIVSLPHDWMITGKPEETNPSGKAGGFYPGGIGWYRKQLEPENFEGWDQFYLVFDGVYMNSDVWINGHYLGGKHYGYIGFHFDISEYILKDTTNVIAVRTDCSTLPTDRWYSGAGIYRHVKLIRTSNLHFPVFPATITTKEMQGYREVDAQIRVVNNEKRPRRFKIKSDLLGPDGSLVGTVISSMTIKGYDTVTVNEQIQVENPVFWSDTNPALYEIHSFLLNRKRVVDNITNTFGIRDISFSPDSGFILNNKKVWLKGVCIHHDGGALGSAVPDATWEYRLKAFKELGVNALRLAHNPHAPEVLEMCDRMGFFVIDEMYDKWEFRWSGESKYEDFNKTCEEDLAYFIERDKNHPCVIAWSVGNETYHQLRDPAEGSAIYRKLADVVYSVDTTRDVTCGLHPGGSGSEIPSSFIQVEPLVSYNYRTDSFATWHQQHPEITWLASETKAYNENRSDHFEDISYLDNSWMEMETFIAGQFIWSGIDYLGESGGWPYTTFNQGLLKTNAEIKPSAYYTQSIYSDKPMVKIVVVSKELADSLNRETNKLKKWAGAPVVRHWNFDEGEMLQVLLYTNCQEVEIELNDSTLVTLDKKSFDDGVIKTRVGYLAGKIHARAWYTDKAGTRTMVEDSILTAGKPAMILLQPDKTQMIADGSDVVHIRTSVTDTAGTTYPTADHMINYTVEGPGKIRVIDNGNPSDSTPYGSLQKRVFNGTQLVVIQSTLQPGDLTISASAAGLQPARLKVQSIQNDKK